MALIERNLAGLSSKGSKQKLFRFVDGAGRRIEIAETFTLACGSDERIIISSLYSDASGGTSDFTFDAGSRRIYNQGDKVIDDQTPSSFNQTLAVVNGQKETNSNIVLGIGEDFVFDNLSASQFFLWWQIEQTYEG